MPQLGRCIFYFGITVLSRSTLDSKHAAAMDVFEVAIGKFVSSFGVLGITLVDCQMPLCVLAEAMLPNKLVLELGRRPMLVLHAFSIRDEVSLFNELHAKGESVFV